MKRIILASASPRRRELLSQIGLEFDIVPSDTDETFDDNLSCEENVKKIAYNKVCYIAPEIDDNCIIIGADTVVSIDEKVLGKPSDKKDAAKMLKRLSGKTHDVYTGYAVMRKSDYKTEIGCEKTSVTFRELSDKEIDFYINTGEPMDKAGAYGVQGIGALFVKSINGDYNNVVGLPLCSLWQTLKKFGLSVEEAILE